METQEKQEELLEKINEMPVVEEPKEKKKSVQTKAISSPTIENNNLRLKDMDQLKRYCALASDSGMMPRGLDTPSKIFMAIQFGTESGLTRTQSIKSVAMINGMPSLHTDGPLSLVMKSGKLEKYTEYFFDKDKQKIDPLDEDPSIIFGSYCEMKRKGLDTIMNAVYTLSFASTANLYPASKPSMPWNQHPHIMLKRRARAIVIKDLFPDVIGGLDILEYNDPRDVTPNEKKSLLLEEYS